MANVYDLQRKEYRVCPLFAHLENNKKQTPQHPSSELSLLEEINLAQARARHMYIDGKLAPPDLQIGEMLAGELAAIQYLNSLKNKD